MRDEIFKTLEARWRELYDQYETVKAVLPPVIRWEWVSGRRYDPRPFCRYRYPGFASGRVLKQSPLGTYAQNASAEYGFDAQGRVIVERRYDGSQTFRTYTPDRIEIATFLLHQGQYILIQIRHCIIKDRQLQHYASLQFPGHVSLNDSTETVHDLLAKQLKSGEDSESVSAQEAWDQLLQIRQAMQWGHEEYAYQKRCLTHIQRYTHLSLAAAYESEDLLEYDAAGHLQSLTEISVSGSQRIVYRRRVPDETSESLRRQAVEKLIEAIPPAVAAMQFTQPLYGLGLEEHLPPTLRPRFESYRQWRLLMAENFTIGPEGPLEILKQGVLWKYPPDIDQDMDDFDDDDSDTPIPTTAIRITDEETLDACARLRTDAWTKTHHEYDIKMRHEVARALNQLDWSQITPVTPDFIVYAVDYSHVNLVRSLHRSGATKAQIADWRKRGWL